MNIRTRDFFFLCLQYGNTLHSLSLSVHIMHGLCATDKDGERERGGGGGEEAKSRRGERESFLGVLEKRRLGGHTIFFF